ncbi:MAG: phage terminase large subunit family protein [Paenisporosarcina sp.]
MSKKTPKNKESKEKVLLASEKTYALFKNLAKVLAPPPKLKVSEWADAYRQLSKEASAEPGKWRTDRAPYQREIMDAVNDPKAESVIVMSSSQVGKSEIINNIIGYYIDYDPSPILLLMPTLEMAESYSKDRIASMIRDTTVLSKKVGDSKSRDGNNTLLHKKFPGGHLSLVGANSPASLASRPIRIVLADEVDRFPVSAGTEGDPLTLAHQRTKTFWNRKKVSVSTPTVKDASRIEAEYNDSTMEQWCISCPSCGFFQPYTWAQIRFEPVGMACISCKEEHVEYEWKQRPGKWIARMDSENRGFHLNALASPWESWSNIIKEFKKAKHKGVEMLKTWTNTTLGESWEEQQDEQDIDQLIKRRDKYVAEVPDGVLVLTAGVDVQDDRLEVEIVGWGMDEVSYGISYQIFYGDIGQQEVWSNLDDFLQKEWAYEDGSRIILSAVCIDSGGHYTQDVYRFCKEREHRRIFAIKGKGGIGVPFIGKATRNNRERAALFTLGVDAGKELIISRLKVDFENKAGYCHFPINEERGYDEAYFIGLTSEKRRISYYKGQPKVEWIKKSGARNEPLDLRNYATAAFKILNPLMEVLHERRKSGQSFLQAPAQGVKKKKRRVMSKGL